MLCRPQNIFEWICFPDSIYFSLNTDQISVVTDLTIIGQVKTTDNMHYIYLQNFRLKKSVIVWTKTNEQHKGRLLVVVSLSFISDAFRL